MQKRDKLKRAIKHSDLLKEPVKKEGEGKGRGGVEWGGKMECYEWGV